MPQTQSALEDSESSRAHEKAVRANLIVADRRAAERSRRSRRWARRELDALLDLSVTVSVVGGIDYDAMGFTLGMPERRAAGLALLERERAA